MLVDTAVAYLAKWYMLPKKTSNVVLSFQISNAILEVQAGLAIDWNCGVMLSQSQFSSVLLEIFTVFLHACNASIRLRNKA